MIPTEYEEQCAFVEWLEMKGLKFTAIPNSTWTKSWAQKRKNWATGLRKGLPDLIVIVPRKIGIKNIVFVEMKRQKGGVVSPEQKEWLKELQECKEVEARVCKGAKEAIKFIEEIIELD